jgi:hypothetical protein
MRENAHHCALSHPHMALMRRIERGPPISFGRLQVALSEGALRL